MMEQLDVQTSMTTSDHSHLSQRDPRVGHVVFDRRIGDNSVDFVVHFRNLNSVGDYN